MPGRQVARNSLGQLTSTGHDPMTMEQAQNVGILAAEVYFPSTFVRQEDLEKHDGVPAGKYTIGLGQQGLSFCGDREDSVSMAMTVLRQLMDRHGIAAGKIGRLEVGTESEVDASKSIKSHLMMVLQEEDSSATDVEGCDCVHACYGGTVAVLNAMNWIESQSWDGRYAVVVMSDLSIYARGPARPTSGAGAVALLLGPDAPLVFERGLQATYVTNAYDFYKPSGLYPLVDGPMSVYCYLEALDKVYERFSAKFATRSGRAFSMADADHALFHSPYNKLVQRAYARLLYLDLSRVANGAKRENGSGSSPAPEANGNGAAAIPAGVPSITVPLGEGAHPFHPAQMPKELDKALVAQSFQEYDRKVRPSSCVARLCGNMYTASVWSGVAQLIETTGADLEGRRMLIYSYGSGIAATLMSVVGRKIEGQFSLERLQSMSDLSMRLARRMPKRAEEFEEAMSLGEARFGSASYRPEMPSIEDLETGTYYLDEVDSKYRRKYCRKVT